MCRQDLRLGYEMTTYTITQAQYDELYSIGEFAGMVRTVLKALKPNSNEPVGYMDSDGNTSDNNYHGCFPIALYDHPAPMSKEDMVKVLEALEDSYDFVNLDYLTNWRHGIPTREAQLAGMKKGVDDHAEAITIMQSAIEGMK